MTNFKAYQKISALCDEEISLQSVLEKLPTATNEFNDEQTKAVCSVVDRIATLGQAKDRAKAEIDKGNISNAVSILRAIECCDEPFFFIDEDCYTTEVSPKAFRLGVFGALCPNED